MRQLVVGECSNLENKSELIKAIKNKRVLYIATKNQDYIRIDQEITLLKKYAAYVEVICEVDKKYWKRVIKIYTKLAKISVKNFDIIFVGFMAQMIVPIWGWKWKNKVIITDFFISVYDTLIFDRKKFNPSSFFAWLTKKIDGRTIEKSSYLVVDTLEHGKYFCSEWNKDQSDVFVLYLEADKKIYYPMTVKKPSELKDKFLVLYFGSILPVQGVEIVIEAIRLLENEDQIHFYIIGPIKNKIDNIELKNVTYFNWLPQNELAKAIGCADLCLAGHFSATVGKAKRTIPGKAYIYDSMDKPMILGDTPANHEIYKEDDNHQFVPVGNPYLLAEAIKKRIVYIQNDRNLK